MKMGLNFFTTSVVLMALWGCASAPSSPTSVQTPRPKQSIDAHSDQITNAYLSETFDGVMDESELEDVADQDGGSLDQLFSLCHLKRTAEALALADRLYASFVKVPAYWNAIATCYLLKDDLNLAQLYYNKALELDRSYAPALNNLAIYYFKNREEQKAYLALMEALKASRFAVTPRVNLAFYFLRYGYLDLAQKEITYLQEKEVPTAVLARLEFYFALSTQDYQGAQKAFEQIERPSVGDKINAGLVAGKLEGVSAAEKILSSFDGEKFKNYAPYIQLVRKELGK